MNDEGMEKKIAEFRDALHKSNIRLKFLVLLLTLTIAISGLNHFYHIFSDEVKTILLGINVGSFAAVVWDRVKMNRFKRQLHME